MPVPPSRGKQRGTMHGGGNGTLAPCAKSAQSGAEAGLILQESERGAQKNAWEILTKVVQDDVDIRLVGVQRSDLQRAVIQLIAAAAAACLLTIFPKQVKYKEFAAVTIVNSAPALQ